MPKTMTETRRRIAALALATLMAAVGAFAATSMSPDITKDAHAAKVSEDVW